jgi:CRISPR-associated protein Csx3
MPTADTIDIACQATPAVFDEGSYEELFCRLARLDLRSQRARGPPSSNADCIRDKVNNSMARFFTANVECEKDGVVLVHIGFAEPAANTDIVPDAVEALLDLELRGGKGIRFTGHMSVPVAMTLAHSVAHLYGYVACYDPKLQGYVVTISHDPAFVPGQLLRNGESSVTPKQAL